ncbi:DUF4056 domain-containing protein [Salmonella enterica subsp. houtenae]|nr:DUF4056 domain-containing protein [Salmonella enterica subsp. houtenae]ECI3633531.1 DUF4056 domain-containing protein [Salmonella enterica subsp. houtenae]ECI3709413.1 DUF4056 domain-containing protein [Salmonella enterica subsp. houtenae]MLR86589.1 DUF4056 domain-containing protein [Salmonella enterica subsp. houtenae]
MRTIIRGISLTLLFLAGSVSANAALPLTLYLSTPLMPAASEAWPTMQPQPLPKGLRPCCAFGYDLRAELLGLPIPFYQLNNVVTADSLGHHQYNDHLYSGLANLTGLSGENNGIVYTLRGGFIDTAHVRDTADMTVYIFSQLLPKLGQAFTLNLGDELAERRLVFTAFPPPIDVRERYTLAVWLSAHLAFQVAEWHEIAQWYGFESVSGFSEGVSAFSPEDLYSNLAGARLAASLILDGQTKTQEMYNTAMETALRQALTQLAAQSAQVTRFQFDMLDGRWWNSQRRVPEKYLVLHRNYQMGDNRLPTAVPGELTPPLPLKLPHYWRGIALSALAQLQLWPGDGMRQLPSPTHYYSEKDFASLAEQARL